MSGLSLVNSTSNGDMSSTINGAGSGAVELSDSGRALKLQTDSPHLVSMGGDRLSTSVTLHPIPQGRITLGSGTGVDIPIQGTGVLPLHCHIENSEGIVTIYPLSENVSIDGEKINGPTRLSQGVMLTIGRSNYLRFNHPAEAKLIKSVIPNPRISMAPINFEPDNTFQAKFNKKPPAVPRKNSHEPPEELPPSNIMTKVSKFEYLAAQNFKKSISPKVFSSNLVTVNTPAKDVLGKAPPDINSFTKNLPQSALNYSELNYNEKQQMKSDRTMFGRKSPQYVNVQMCDKKNVNNRVLIYENGNIPKNQNVNFDHNELNNKTSSCNKNINMNKMSTSLTTFRSVTPSPVFNNRTIADQRRSGSLGDLNDTNYDDYNRRKNDAEIRRNQAQKDRMKEQEIEKAEQVRLDEILNMCAEYEKQSQQCEKNKPTPNRIKTNGSLPRDKRQYSPTSPNYSTPPQSPLDILHNELLKHSNHTYENVNIVLNTRENNYENDRLVHVEKANNEVRISERNSPYENVVLQQNNTLPYPPSPRTRIKTFISPNKDACTTKDTTDIIENKFAILETEQYLLLECELKQNLNNSKDSPSENSVLLDSPLRKSTPTKFILPLDDAEMKQTENKIENVNNYENEHTKKRVEELKAQKKSILSVISKIKRQMAEIEIQEEELLREVELEKALISGEHKSKLLDLDKITLRKQKLMKRAQRIEESMRDCQMKQEEDQKECKEKLKIAQENMMRVEEKLSNTTKPSPEYESVFEEYLIAQEQLDIERKAFEDLEFHHLEEEADWLASKEELQREIIELSKRIDNLKILISDLEQQKLNTSKNNTLEYKNIEKQKMECMMRLEEIRNQLKHIDNELISFSYQESDQEISSDSESDKSKDLEKQLSSRSFARFQDMCSSDIVLTHSKLQSEHVYNMSQSFNEKLLPEKSIVEIGIGGSRKFPSQDDIDRISKVTSNAPINLGEGEGSLGRKTLESLREIERNRQLHLHQQGSQVIEKERQRLLELKQRAQQEVKTKWAQQRQECTSFTSSGSEDITNSNVNEESSDKNSSTKPSQYTQEEVDRDSIVKSDSSRPLSQSSEMSVETENGTLNRKRIKPAIDKQRPLTRYLPIRSESLNLRQHIESAGHQVVLCPHVIIDHSTCKGFLHKKGSKLNGWSRRWFVFDRNKHTLTYYSDKSEKKTRGGAYFQAIEEVYLDHLNNVKSPNPHLTFIVKTHERSYYLMAPSPEAMRIWVDVIFTGAEGYREYEHDT